jgi:DeoR family transcriptional regulator, ulaG and ulaABCDEF operon transcriptional repressor
MRAEEREAEILGLLSRRKGYIAFHDMENQVRFSPATLRRDLQRMARDGRIKRIRGGAKLSAENNSGASPLRLAGVPFRENISRSIKQKQAIGFAAAALCRQGEKVIIDGGTTTLQMCRHLEGLNLHVVTNSLHIVTALLLQTGTRVQVPTGVVYPEQSLILNPNCDDALPCARAAQLFMSAVAVGPQGLMQAEPLLSSTQRRMIERVDEVILLVDSSKFQGVGNIVCALGEVDVVVTDPGITTRAVTMLEAAGIKVIIAT